MKVVTGISVDTEILKKSRVIAKELNRSFSNYIQWLMVEHQNQVAHQYPATKTTPIHSKLKRKNPKK